jgi:hypothetical protein
MIALHTEGIHRDKLIICKTEKVMSNSYKIQRVYRSNTYIQFKSMSIDVNVSRSYLCKVKPGFQSNTK